MSENKKNLIPLPEYRPTSFHTLWRLLGESDSGLEWLEVALRELLRVHQEGGSPASSVLAQRHKIKVNDLEVGALKAHWARLQIVTVAQYLELFLDQFRSEIPRDVRTRTNKEDLVIYTLDVYKVKTSLIGELQCDLLDYYRKVRNQFVHDPAADASKKLVRQAESLRQKIQASSNPYSTLAAPNPPAATSFDDFVLFSRALKDFSKGLCANVVLTEDELRGKIAADLQLIGSLRREKVESGRQTRILANYVRQHFGFHHRADSIAEKFLKEGLLAQR